jgi:GH24 family phage-related lysozyme (muramidase)
MLGNFGPSNVLALSVGGANLAISIDSSGITPSPILSHAPYDGLTLRHIFGTERVDVPVTIDNHGQGEAEGDATIVLYLSTTPDLSGTHVAIDSKPERIDLQASASMSETLSGVEIPGSLAVGQTYYLVAEFRGPSIQESDNLDATEDAFEFVGTPAWNEAPFVDGTYFAFIEDTLDGNLVVSRATMADPKSFIGHFEGDYRYPYFDPAGIASIGVGINLTDMAPKLKQALVKDVRAFYRAHHLKKLPKSDDRVISMLIDQAHANGAAPSRHRPKDVISIADDRALFNMAFADHEANVIKAVGAAIWNDLKNASARTTLVDLDYNVKRGLAGEFPTLVRDVRNRDFIKAGFDLVDAKRTTQLPGLTVRTEADYQALLTGLPNYRSLLVGP